MPSKMLMTISVLLGAIMAKTVINGFKWSYFHRRWKYEQQYPLGKEEIIDLFLIDWMIMALFSIFYD